MRSCDGDLHQARLALRTPRPVTWCAGLRRTGFFTPVALRCEHLRRTWADPRVRRRHP